MPRQLAVLCQVQVFGEALGHWSNSGQDGKSTHGHPWGKGQREEKQLQVFCS